MSGYLKAISPSPFLSFFLECIQAASALAGAGRGSGSGGALWGSLGERQLYVYV
jgi:hypothetical protein